MRRGKLQPGRTLDDHFDSKTLVKACVAAGCAGIEYTLRRRDAHVMVPWIREHYPELFLLVGSTIDDDRIVTQMKKRHPQLLTLAEIDALGLDGFVSMIGWSAAVCLDHRRSRRDPAHRRGCVSYCGRTRRGVPPSLHPGPCQ